MTTIKEQGYLLVFDFKNGNMGYLGIDDHSGGYNFFSTSIDTRIIRQDINDSIKDLQTFNGMKTFYNNNNVDFNSVRIVMYSHVFETVDYKKEQRKLDNILAKLTADELEVLKRRIINDNR